MANGTWTNTSLYPISTTQYRYNPSAIIIGDVIYWVVTRDDYDSTYSATDFYKYNITTNTLTSLPGRGGEENSFERRIFYDAINNRIYLTGKHSQFYGDTQDYVIFDIGTNAWIAGNNLGGSNHFVYGCQYNGKTWWFGSRAVNETTLTPATGIVATNNTYLNPSTTFLVGELKYNGATNTPTMSKGLMVGSRVYFTGVNDPAYYKKMAVYDMDSKAWMPSTTVADVSGTTDLTTTGKFNGTLMWNIGSDIYCYSAATWNGSALIFDNKIRIYNVNTNTWRLGATVSFNRLFTSGVLYQGGMHMIMGMTGTSNNVNWDISKFSYVLSAPTDITVEYINNHITISCTDTSDEEDYYVVKRKADNESTYTQISVDGTLLPDGNGKVAFTDLTADVLTRSYEYKMYCKKVVV